MSREVIWTRRRFELLCVEGMLCDEDRIILEMHIKRASNQEIATARCCDVGTVAETISRLKLVYDEVQKQFPDQLDKRSKDVFRKK